MKYTKIEGLAKSKGLTLGGLAEKIGVTRAGFYRTLEQKTMKVETLEKIAQVLDVPVCEFFETHEDDAESIKFMKTEILNKEQLLLHAMHLLFNARNSALRLYEAVMHFKKTLEEEQQAECFNHPAAEDLNKVMEILTKDNNIYEHDKAISLLSNTYMNSIELKVAFMQYKENKK